MSGYDAFISYGQAADGELAAALQTGLQRLAKPWNKRRALEVFRDSTGLSATHDLRGTLLSSLKASRFVVLLASPDSAASPWVNDELTTFLGGDESAWQRVIVVVTAGEWKWAGDGRYTDDSTAVPPALQGAFPTEPLYVDMRWAKGHSELTLTDPRFKAAVADIAAPIRGIPEDELIGEDVRQFKLAKRLRWSAVIGLSVLLVASLIASVIAVGQGREAVRQRNAAEEQTELARAAEATANEERDRAEAATAEALESAAVARSGELATLALALKDDDPEVAAALAVESLFPNDETEMRRSGQADSAVGVTSRGLFSRQFVPSGSLPEATNVIPVASVGRYLATLAVPQEFDACWPKYVGGVGEPTPITWWDRESGGPVEGVPPGVELPVSFVATAGNVFRLDDELTATPLAGEPVRRPVVLPAMGEVETEVDIRCEGHRAPTTYDAASGTIVSFDDGAGQFVAADAVTGQERSRMNHPTFTGWTDVAVIAGLVVATAQEAEAAPIWSLTSGGAPLGETPLVASWIETSATWMAAGSTTARIQSSADDGVRSQVLQEGMEFATSVAFSADERFMATTNGSDVKVWRLGSEVPVASLPSNSVRSVFWAGEELAVVSARGVGFYRRRDQPSLADLYTFTVSGDGSVAAGYGDGLSTVYVYDATDPFAGPVAEFETGSFGSRTELSYDGSLMLTVSPQLKVYRVPSGEAVLTEPAFAASFDPAGAQLAVVGYPEGDAATAAIVEILDTGDWSVQATLAGPTLDGIRGVEWLSADHVVLVGFDGTVHSYRRRAGEWTQESVAWPSATGGLWADPASGLVAIADGTGRLELWSMADGADGGPVPAAAPIVVGTQAVTDVSFSGLPGQMITSAADGLTLWDVEDLDTPRRVEVLSELPALRAGWDPYNSPAQFGADGRLIFVRSFRTVIVLPGFDPVRACAELADSDLDRAEAIIGGVSACRRIPGLQPAG